MLSTRTNLLICLLITCLATPVITAGDEVWMTDLSAAKAKAAENNKDLLVLFTGSDWCGWCRKLENEKLGQKEFLEDARKHYILVKIDFPRRREQPPEQLQQNAILKQQYRITRLPNVFLCDSEGKPYARAGYRKGDAASYSKHLAELRQRKVTRDTQLKLAETLKGPEKARALEKALSVLPRSSLSFYQDVVTTIRDLDPEDTSGFYKRYQIQKTTIELRHLIKPMIMESKFAKVPGEVENYIRQHKLKEESLQTALTFILSAQCFSKDHKAALKTADRIIAVNEFNRPGRYATIVKKRIQRKRAK